MSPQPNVIVVFGDQWRAQATGYAGDPNLAGHTPTLDRLAAESCNFSNAVSGCPVCSPYRASLLTGQYPLRHGVFLNDVALQRTGTFLGQAFANAGYDTAYIGKWHVDGDDRGAYIPPDRRAGFDFWEVLGCTHNYNDSWYWGNDDKQHKWQGYDAIDQTRHACDYVRQHAQADRPFMLTLSWGPPHAPYETAPVRYRVHFDPEHIQLRPNVPLHCADQARTWLAGYYAHIATLDDCLAQLLDCLDHCDVASDTILLFTSDHGDMLGCQGQTKKQRPWDESIRVPFLVRYPALGAGAVKSLSHPIDAPDVMPTLLGLAGVSIPDSVQGRDFSPLIRGESEMHDMAALLACYSPFGQYERTEGGREYRGLRTEHYTYVRTLDGPWLLYDNLQDQHQLHNRIGDPQYHQIQDALECRLHRLLRHADDEFLPADEYIRRWQYHNTYRFNDQGTVMYKDLVPSDRHDVSSAKDV